jgi:nitroreductase
MDYEQFLGLMKYRRTVEKLKTDPIPDDYVTKILDAARYSMSGGNSQPWEFIVVKDPVTKKLLVDAYIDFHFDLLYHLEMQRIPQYRNPGKKYHRTTEENAKNRDTMVAWQDAPVFICVIEDPRKQFGSLLGTRSNLSLATGSMFATTMGHLCMSIQLAVASLGLGSRRIDIAVQAPFREILKFPEPLSLNIIVPVGYRAYEPGPPGRLALEDLVHYEQYDQSRFMRNQDFLAYLDKIRGLKSHWAEGQH